MVGGGVPLGGFILCNPLKKGSFLYKHEFAWRANLQDIHNIKNKKGRGKKGKGKGKKGKGKGYNHNYYNYNYNHYNSYYNQQQQQSQQKRKGKGKDPIGSYDNNASKGKSIHKHRLQSVGSVASSDVELHHAASTTRRTSTTLNNSSYHHTISSSSFRAHQINPSLTCHQKASLPSTFDSSNSYLSSNNNNLRYNINKSNKHYPLRHLHHSQSQSVHTRTSHLRCHPSTIHTTVKEINHQASGDIVTSLTSTN